MDTTADLQKALADIEDQQKDGVKIVGQKQMNYAADDEFLTWVIGQYDQPGDNGIKYITKDKAYLAASKVLERFKQMDEEAAQAYLVANFEAVWKQHDIHESKSLDDTEVYQLLKEL